MEKGNLGRFDELEKDVLTGAAILWIGVEDNAVRVSVVTQILLTEKSKICMVQACGGDGLNNWIGLLPVIENYARVNKCDAVRLMGRKGWARVLKGYGYAIAKVVMERQL